MELLIVGAGAMGRWLADSVGGAVAFADADPAVAAAAAAETGGRAVALDASERFGTVAVAVPMGVTVEAIATHAPKAREAIVHLAGVMAGPTEAMAEHAPDRERASLHPLFAPENAPGRIATVVENEGPAVAAIRENLAAAGNTFVETTPVEHDRAMETVQARAHAAVLAFGLAAEAVPEGFGTPVYDALEDLLTEVTGGTPRVYADIQEAFDGAEDVAEAAARIADADAERFERLYREAGERAGSHSAPDADE
jgi:prephenate dehydrogenase